MKKVLKISSLVILGLIVVVGVYTWMVFGPFIKGVMSVEKLDEGLYYIEYKGDDGFDDLLKRGGGENAQALSGYVIDFLTKGYYTPTSLNPKDIPFGCSTLATHTPDGGMMMGRNFDFTSATAMIMHTVPDKGYESYSTFNMEFFGFGKNWQPESFTNKYMALAGIFFALDGINERGFAIADLMAGDKAETHQRTGKPALTTTSALRYLLNRAATVDEALELLRSIDMHSDIGAAHHYAMADVTGRSVVVEYVDYQMVVTETPAVTNHYLCEAKRNVGLQKWDNRFEELNKHYAINEGVMSEQTLTETIESVALPPREGLFMGTAWTMVMDLSNPSVTYYSRRHFDKPFHFKLGNK